MSPLWAYFWPVFAFGLVLGAGFGALSLRRKRLLFLVAGLLLAAAGAALWHGPAGAADRFSANVEKSAHDTVVAWEMGQVQTHLHHGPLTRRLDLSGTADDFQRSELVRILSDLPGVSRATWSGSAGMPLIVEALLVSALGFVVGLILAYVVELRRRYNAQWKW
jgi:hypothetical protein